MKRIIIFSLLGLAAALAACSNKGTEGGFKPNQAPTVWLSAGPPEGSVSKYRVQMFWGGWDPDGEIKGYEYLISDNKTGTFQPSDTVGVPWLPVTGNDSTFTFSADEPTDTLNTTKQVAEFQRSHTFFIRAIDEENVRSLRPAYRSFTARTLSPEVRVQVPVRNALNAADVPAITTYRWKALDYVSDLSISQDPDSVQWALVPVPAGKTFEYTIAYIRSRAAEKEWQPWVWYKAPQDSGKFWTTPVTDRGNYVFAIRAKDEAGAVTPVLDEQFNIRRVRVGPLTSGPTMTVTNDYIGVIRTSSCNAATTILDSPAGVPLEFKIRADASSYGGAIAGYRYGWDIPNLDDPEQWEIDVTPFLTVASVPPRSFFFGTHTLTMEVVDNSGYCSRVEVKVNIIPFTLERSVLVVDDYSDDNGGWDATDGSEASDAQRDGFWRDMMSDVTGFDPQIDMIDTKSLNIPLATLAQYKSIVWDVSADVARSSSFPLLYSYIAFRPKNPDTGQAAIPGKILPNVLALTMAAGGHVMVCGTQPIQCVVSRQWAPGAKYPIIWLYDMMGVAKTAPDVNNPVGDLTFAYRELCLETLDFSLLPTSIIRKRGQQYCPVNLARIPTPTSNRDDTMREAVPIDPNFPSLTLRPEAAGPGRWYNEASRGLNVEVYNPAYFRKGGVCEYVPTTPRDCFQPIYGLGCLDTLEKTYHQPIAFWTSAYANRVAEVPGAVGARSVVFGFDPTFVDPAAFKQAMDYILFTEWKLPMSSNQTATRP